MNFLPDENKIIVKQEYFKRLFATFGFLVSFIVLAGAIPLFSFFVLMKINANSFEKQINITKKQTAEEKINEIIPIIEDINAKIIMLGKYEDDSKEMEKKSDIIKKLIGLKNNGISLSSFSFTDGAVEIKGRSKKRNDLIVFLESLKKEETFKKIDSPIHNLLKGEDIEFSLNIEL